MYFFFLFVVLFKEFCCLYFHNNANQRNMVIVLFRVTTVISHPKILAGFLPNLPEMILGPKMAPPRGSHVLHRLI